MPNWNSSDFLEHLLAARSRDDVHAIMADLPIVPPEQYQWDYKDRREGDWISGHLHWLPVGLDRGNDGRIRLAGEPINPIAERLVNGIEALIELERLLELRTNPNAKMPANPRDAVMHYFGLPPLDSIERLEAAQREIMTERFNAVRSKLGLWLDYTRHKGGGGEFAITVRDRGMGQTAEHMATTLLSLGQSDKDDKPYLIGVFGQGGSSAFSASDYSVIVSRRAPSILKSGESGNVGWSIVREIHPKGRRGRYYAYLAVAETGEVPKIDETIVETAGFGHGTHFCHINYDFGGSASAISQLLYQSLNHALFNPLLPYDLYAIKDVPDRMLGTAQRLARQVRLSGKQGALDKSFSGLLVVDSRS